MFFSSVVSLLIACFFELGDPHNSVYFTVRKPFFHFSCFFIFTTKIIENRCENTVPKNDQKIMVWASILGPKIDENRRRKARKAPKLWKHIVFGRYRFFIVFLMHFSMNFGSPGRPRGASKIDFSATFFDFFARLSLQSCSWGLLGPFRVNISSIFGWFWHDFGSISSRIFCQFAVVLLPLLDRFWIVFFARARFSNVFFDRPCEKNSD